MNAGAVATEMAVRMLHHGENWTDEDVAGEVERIQGEQANAQIAAALADEADVKEV